MLDMPKEQISYDDITYKVGNNGDKSGSLSPFTFLCLVLVLALFGLVQLYSVSFPIAVREGLSHYHYFLLQVIAAGFGLAAGLVLYFIPLKAIRKLYFVFYPVAIASGILILFPQFSEDGYLIVDSIRIASPGSLAAVAAAFMAADIIPEPDSIGGGLVREYVLSFIFLTVLLVLTLFSSGLSWFIIISMIVLSAYAIKGTGKVAVAVYAVLIAACAAVLFALFDSISDPVLASIVPSSGMKLYDSDLSRALLSFADGGIAGKGLGSGLEDPFSYGSAESIFIFPSIARELGANGCAFIVILFAFVMLIGVRTAMRALRREDLPSATLVLSLTLVLVLKAVLNMLYASGLLPLPGVLLPFFSYSVSEEGMNIAVSVLLYRMIYMIGRENAQG